MTVPSSRSILALANKKPILAVVAILLGGMSIAGTIIPFLYRAQIHELREQIIRKDKDIVEHKLDLKILQHRIDYKDSLYSVQIIAVKDKANLEMEAFMRQIMQEQKDRINKQEMSELERRNLLYRNQKAIRKTETIIHNIRDEK